MAYLAPLFDEVDFDFVSPGYVAPGGGFILMDMAGDVAPPVDFFFQQIWEIKNPPVPVPDFYFQQAYQVLLEFDDPPPIYPVTLTYNTITAIRYQTDVIASRGGFEQRNRSWEIPLHSFDLAQDIKVWEDLNQVIGLFKTVKGQELTFLIKDPFNFKSTSLGSVIDKEDQFIGIGDGVNAKFQLKKTYSISNLSYTEDILYPDITTILISVDGGAAEPHIPDPNTGSIFMDTVPANGTIITAGYEFYRRVRFDSNQLSIALQNYKLGSASLQVSEVRDA